VISIFLALSGDDFYPVRAGTFCPARAKTSLAFEFAPIRLKP
jgi:hypothetical protein